MQSHLSRYILYNQSSEVPEGKIQNDIVSCTRQNFDEQVPLFILKICHYCFMLGIFMNFKTRPCFFQKLYFICSTEDNRQDLVENASMEKGSSMFVHFHHQRRMSVNIFIKRMIKKLLPQARSLCGYLVLLLLPALLILSSNRILHSQLQTTSQVQRGNHSTTLLT